MKSSSLLDSLKSRSILLNKSIVIPEQDSRISTAKNILQELGVNIFEPDDFMDNREKYFNYLSGLKFTDNWSEQNINELLLNPSYFAMTMVACGDADCVVSGATIPSSDVIRNSIRSPTIHII